MIRFKGQEFDTIDKFTCSVLSFSNKEGGGCLSCPPISNQEYRKERPTMARVEIVSNCDSVVFNIVDDWGSLYSVDIDNEHQEEIEHATECAKEKGLLE